MTDLEGRSLDEALAQGMGWSQVDSGWWWTRPLPVEYPVPEGWRTLPEWHASLDALLRDIEPVCRERGMLRLNIEQAGENLWNAFAKMRSGMSQYDEPQLTDMIAKMRSGMSQYEHGTGPTAAIATARVFYAVLTRGER